MLWLSDKLIAFLLYLVLFGSLISAIITYGHNPSAVKEIAIEASLVVFALLCLIGRLIISPRMTRKRPETIEIWLYRICGVVTASAVGLFGITPLTLWMLDGTPPLETMMKVVQVMTKH